MKKTLFSILFGLIPAVYVYAILVKVAAAEEAVWTSDFPAAQAKAKAEKKLLLADFTGSDWCIWCKKLKAEVFDKEPFAAETSKQFVLVELDYPREKKLSDKLKEQNAALQIKYKIRGYPTVLLLTPDGDVVAHTGYRAGGAEKYTKQLADLVTTYESLAGLRDQLPKAKGLDRAKLLDQLVDAYDKLGNESDDAANWGKEIIALDSDNKAGLKVKYQYRDFMSEIALLRKNRKNDEAQAVVDKALNLPGLTGEQKQNVYLTTADFYGFVAGPGKSKESLKKALDFAPESDRAASIKTQIEWLEKSVKDQDAALKLKAEVETATGKDRTKLLDDVLSAYAKISNRIDGKDQSADVTKWSKEIVQLDSDNKAGMRSKYEFLLLIRESQLARIKNPAAAEAAIDKALALKDLKPIQIQQAAYLKANLCLTRNDYKAGAECLDKALAVAPDGAYATILKTLLKQCKTKMEVEKTPKSPGKEVTQNR